MSATGAHSVSFSSGIAWEVLGKACEAAGLPADGARLIRFGQNAIFLLQRRPVVVRVGRSTQRMPIFERELCVARWLISNSVPAARPLDDVEHPVDVNGHPVSFWHAVDSADPAPVTADLALLLRQFHAAGESPCALPPLDPLAEVGNRLDAATDVPDDDRDFLRRYAADLRDRYDHLEFELPSGALHGDAHTGNLLGQAGAAVLTDFESAAVGPREWDLTPVAVAHKRLGLSSSDYQTFAAGYGFDVTKWRGFDVLRGIREIGMTTWLMQNIGEGPKVAREFSLRLESMRNGDDACEWHAL